MDGFTPRLLKTDEQPIFTDKILICIECKEEFAFTASAQKYFAERGFLDDPRRCKSCYLELKKAKKQTSASLSAPVPN